MNMCYIAVTGNSWARDESMLKAIASLHDYERLDRGQVVQLRRFSRKDFADLADDALPYVDEMGNLMLPGDANEIDMESAQVEIDAKIAAALEEIDSWADLFNV